MQLTQEEEQEPKEARLRFLPTPYTLPPLPPPNKKKKKPKTDYTLSFRPSHLAEDTVLKLRIVIKTTATLSVNDRRKILSLAVESAMNTISGTEKGSATVNLQEVVFFFSVSFSPSISIRK